MAGYDTSIRVNTNVDNSDLIKLQKDFDKLEAKLDRLYQKGDKLEALGVNKQSRQWKSLQYDVAQTEIALEDTRDRIREINGLSINRPASEFDKLSDAGKKCFSEIQRGTKKSNGLLSTMKTRLKGIALSLLVFNWITKGFNAMVNSVKDGFHNLAKYSDEYNSSMTELKSQTEQLKNTLAASFEPIANIIIPYLSQLVSWLNTSADSIGQFLAALQGKSTYTKAKKQVIDYAKSLDTASKSAKRALASFDQLNVLNKDNGNISKNSSGNLFETAPVSSSISEFAGSVLMALQPFKDLLMSFTSEVDLEPLNESFMNLLQSAEPFGTYIYDGLLWFLEDILFPLCEFTIEDVVPAFFDLLSASLSLLNTVLQGLKPYGDWLWNNILVPIGSWVADKAVDGIRLLTDALRDFGAWCRGDKEDLDFVTSVVLGFFAGIVTYYTAKKIVTLLGSITKALTAFKVSGQLLISPISLAAIAIGSLAAGIIYLASNWNKLSPAQRAITILGALAAAAVAAAVAIAIFHTAWSIGIAAAAIVGGLALLGLSAACLSSGVNTGNSNAGQNFYYANDFTSSPIPQLANGAVIQGGKPFYAILGDQPAGQTNIESPLSTIEQAVQNVYDRNGNSGDINLSVILDGEKIYQSVVKRDQMFQEATGCSAFAQ